MAVADLFRKEYKALDHQQKLLVQDIKDRATDLAYAIALTPQGREQSIAVTKLEEAVMWAVKAATT